MKTIKYYNAASSAIFSGRGCNIDPTRLSFYVFYFNLNIFEGALPYDATEALLKDRMNAKALYRRGISYMDPKRWDCALAYLKTLSCLDSGGYKEVELQGEEVCFDDAT